jgi:hypothetical protein
MEAAERGMKAKIRLCWYSQVDGVQHEWAEIEHPGGCPLELDEAEATFCPFVKLRAVGRAGGDGPGREHVVQALQCRHGITTPEEESAIRDCIRLLLEHKERVGG